MTDISFAVEKFRQYGAQLCPPGWSGSYSDRHVWREPFRKCTATVTHYTTEGTDDYTVLCSYWTDAIVIDWHFNALAFIGVTTPTTYKHIYKFADEYRISRGVIRKAINAPGELVPLERWG